MTWRRQFVGLKRFKVFVLSEQQLNDMATTICWLNKYLGYNCLNKTMLLLKLLIDDAL